MLNLECIENTSLTSVNVVVLITKVFLCAVCSARSCLHVLPETQDKEVLADTNLF